MQMTFYQKMRENSQNILIAGALSLALCACASAFSPEKAQAPLEPAPVQEILLRNEKPFPAVDLPVLAWMGERHCQTENALSVLAAEHARLRMEKAALASHISGKFRQPVHVVEAIVETAYKEAERHELPPVLVLAIIQKESSFRPDAYNRSGATGLMQVITRYHMDKVQKIRHPKGLFHPESNIRVGSQILAEYIDWAKGDLDRALKRYSGNARNYPRKVQSIAMSLQEVRQSATAEQDQQRLSFRST